MPRLPSPTPPFRRPLLAAGLSLALLAPLSSCSAPPRDPSGPPPAPSDHRADVVNVDYGALEPRLVALDAFDGRRSPVTLRMTRYSVEGAEIVHVLAVTGGRAELSVDERADGGGVRTSALSALRLVRYVPSQWRGDVEVAKEKLVAADPSTARRQPGVYLLAHPDCLRGPCSRLF